jgi:hypothetical protein
MNLSRPGRIAIWLLASLVLQFVSLNFALTGSLPIALFYLLGFCLPAYLWFVLKITPELSPIFSIAAGLFAAMLSCVGLLALFSMVIAPMMGVSFAP